MPKQKIAVFDIDGTIFRSGLYREVVFELLRTKKFPPEAKAIFSEEEVNWKKRKADESFVQYEDKLAQLFYKYLPKLRVKDYEEASRQVVEKMGDFCYVYTRTLLKELRQKGYYLISISGSAEEVVQPFAKRLGFDLAIGALYEQKDGFYTGNFLTKTWHKKDEILEKSLDWKKFTMKDSYAIGDTMGDASILAKVDHPIAFNPQKELFELAQQNGWSVVVERKNMIYHLTPTEKGFLVKC